jgi:hypothetical protein
MHLANNDFQFPGDGIATRTPTPCSALPTGSSLRREKAGVTV